MKRVILLFLVIMFVFSGTAMARDRGAQGKEQRSAMGDVGMLRGKWWKMPNISEKLALSKEESEKLEAMYLEHRRQLVDLRSWTEKDRLELEQVLDSRSFDSTACMDRFKTLQGSQNNLSIERFKFLIQVRELLGLERFQQLKDEVNRHRMQKKHGGQGSKE